MERPKIERYASEDGRYWSRSIELCQFFFCTRCTLPLQAFFFSFLFTYSCLPCVFVCNQHSPCCPFPSVCDVWSSSYYCCVGFPSETPLQARAQGYDINIIDPCRSTQLLPPSLQPWPRIPAASRPSRRLLSTQTPRRHRRHAQAQLPGKKLAPASVPAPAATAICLRILLQRLPRLQLRWMCQYLPDHHTHLLSQVQRLPRRHLHSGTPRRCHRRRRQQAPHSRLPRRRRRRRMRQLHSLALALVPTRRHHSPFLCLHLLPTRLSRLHQRLLKSRTMRIAAQRRINVVLIWLLRFPSRSSSSSTSRTQPRRPIRLMAPRRPYHSTTITITAAATTPAMGRAGQPD